MKDFAQPALLDNLFGEADRRYAAVVKPDHVGLTRFFDGQRHLTRLGEVHSQRFLAEDHLACRGPSQCYLMVCVIRGSNIY